MKDKKVCKYVLVGTGVRALTFAEPLTKEYKESSVLLGLFDNNPKRAEYFSTQLGYPVKVFDDFDVMLDETKPDSVIVTSVDCTHHTYVIKALEKGCDVICEKPLTIDEIKCKEIFAAKKKCGKDIRVTFNCRYMPYFCKLKELIQSGAVGKILSVNYEHLVRFGHGAEYFHRWHRNMKNSGGMFVHKSTHHFDIVNWLLEDEPETVTATGELSYFGPNKRPYSGECCSKCSFQDKCEYYCNIEKDGMNNKMFFKVQDVDGYIRDRCVFGKDIDIYDNMSASVKYKSGVVLTYSLTLFNPYELNRISIAGTEGRLEAFDQYSGVDIDPVHRVRLIKRDSIVEHVFPRLPSDHGGSGSIMRNEIFNIVPPDKKLNRRASVYDGAASLLIGVCANKSVKEKRTINVQDYLKELRV